MFSYASCTIEPHVSVHTSESRATERKEIEKKTHPSEILPSLPKPRQPLRRVPLCNPLLLMYQPLLQLCDPPYPRDAVALVRGAEPGDFSGVFDRLGGVDWVGRSEGAELGLREGEKDEEGLVTVPSRKEEDKGERRGNEHTPIALAKANDTFPSPTTFSPSSPSASFLKSSTAFSYSLISPSNSSSTLFLSASVTAFFCTHSTTFFPSPSGLSSNGDPDTAGRTSK